MAKPIKVSTVGAFVATAFIAGFVTAAFMVVALKQLGWDSSAKEVASTQPGLVVGQASADGKDLSNTNDPQTADVGTPPTAIPHANSEWGTELLPTMIGSIHGLDGNALVLSGDDRITTALRYTAPVEFHIVAMTDSTNLRLACAGADEIIFNWEMNPDHLRIGGGPANNRDERKKGRIPTNQWVEIDVAMDEKTLTLSVDGEIRLMADADFSHIHEPLAIYPKLGSTVRVKSVRVQKSTDGL